MESLKVILARVLINLGFDLKSRTLASKMGFKPRKMALRSLKTINGQARLKEYINFVRQEKDKQVD